MKRYRFALIAFLILAFALTSSCTESDSDDDDSGTDDDDNSDAGDDDSGSDDDDDNDDNDDNNDDNDNDDNDTIDDDDDNDDNDDDTLGCVPGAIFTEDFDSYTPWQLPGGQWIPPSYGEFYVWPDEWISSPHSLALGDEDPKAGKLAYFFIRAYHPLNTTRCDTVWLGGNVKVSTYDVLIFGFCLMASDYTEACTTVTGPSWQWNHEAVEIDFINQVQISYLNGVRQPLTLNLDLGPPPYVLKLDVFGVYTGGETTVAVDDILVWDGPIAP